MLKTLPVLTVVACLAAATVIAPAHAHNVHQREEAMSLAPVSVDLLVDRATVAGDATVRTVPAGPALDTSSMSAGLGFADPGDTVTLILTLLGLRHRRAGVC